MKELCDILCIPYPPTYENVKKGYAIKAKEFHPDKGGSNKDFIGITNAKNELIKYLKTPKNITLDITLEECYYGVSKIINGSTISIPMNAKHGDIIKLENLTIKLNEVKHNKFTRVKNNLAMIIEVPLFRALVGGEYLFTDIENMEYKIILPECVKNNQIIVSPQLGMKSKSGKRGDLYLKVNIIMPDNLQTFEKICIMQLL